MPWKIENGKETYRKPAPGPFDMPPGIEPDSEAANAWLREHRHEFDLWFKRLVVDFVEIHKYCPKKACRRAKECRSPTYACHDEAKPVLDETFYPELRALLRRERMPPADDDGEWTEEARQAVRALEKGAPAPAPARRRNAGDRRDRQQS